MADVAYNFAPDTTCVCPAPRLVVVQGMVSRKYFVVCRSCARVGQQADSMLGAEALWRERKEGQPTNG